MISIFLLIIITFIPILLWGYIFSYLDNNKLNRKRFFFGILAGGLSVIPILYLENIIKISGVNLLNIFYYISNIVGFFSFFKVIISFVVFTLFVLIISFLFGISFGNVLEKFNKYIKLIFKMFLTFIAIILIISLIIAGVNFLVGYFPMLNFGFEDNGIVFDGIAFDSFKLVLLYYIVIGFIEEISKHFNFLQTDVFGIDSVKKGVLYGIFIALGFSFIENILYLMSIYNTNGFNGSIVTTYFFRSIFSVFLHVICTGVISLYFTKAFLYYRESKINLSFFKLIISGFLISIGLHTLFDVSLTLGFTFIIFIYFIFGYIYISGIFYKE